MATIIEVLRCAEVNLVKGNALAAAFGREQLHSAIVLLEKGYTPFGADVEELLAKHGSIEQVPEADGET